VQLKKEENRDPDALQSMLAAIDKGPGRARRDAARNELKGRAGESHLPGLPGAKSDGQHPFRLQCGSGRQHEEHSP